MAYVEQDQKLDSNYQRITYLPEFAWGEIPATGDPKTLRVTGQSLNFTISTIRSEEIRSDRMTADLVQTDAEAAGDIPVEASYGNADDFIEAALMGTWSGPDDFTGAVTAVTEASDLISMPGTGGIAVGHLVYLTGFGSAAADGTVTDVSAVSSDTSITVSADLAADAGPFTDARVKVVGFMGTSGDLVATYSGGNAALTSTTLDFTTLGIEAGDWVKIGGTASGDKFEEGVTGDISSATATTAVLGTGSSTNDAYNGLLLTITAGTGAGQVREITDYVGASKTCTVGTWDVTPDATSDFSIDANPNGWARVSAVAANTLTFDVAPPKFAAALGTGKTVKVWMGDVLNNGIVKRSFTVERTHMDGDQFFTFKGMRIGSMSESVATGSILTQTFTFMGKDTTRATSTAMPGTVQDTTPGDVFNSVGDVVDVRENGEVTASIQSLSLSLNNNLRGQKAVGTLGNTGVGYGDCEVTGDMTVYFEDGDAASVYDRYRDNADTSFSWVITQDNQAIVTDIPRAKISACTVEAGARNQDCTLNMSFQGIRDATLDRQISKQRFFYVE